MPDTERKSTRKIIDVVIASECKDLKSGTISELLNTYDSKKLEVPITITHEKTGKLKSWASFGWVKGLKKKGSDMLASIEVLPELAGCIKAGLLKKRSIGYRFVNGVAKLHHVAMLGADIPRIKGMEDMDLTYSDESEACIMVAFAEEETKIKNKNGGSIIMDLTKEQLGDFTDTAVNKAVKEKENELKDKINSFSEKVSDLEGQIEILKKTILTKDNEIKEFSEKLNSIKVESDIDKLITKGKIEPRSRDSEIKDFSEMLKFSEDLYSSRIEKLKKQKNVIEFGEQSELNGSTPETQKTEYHTAEEVKKYYDKAEFSLGG